MRAVASPTMADSVTYTLTFSEAVTGVTASNFSVVMTGVTAASVGEVSGGGVVVVRLGFGIERGEAKGGQADEASEMVKTLGRVAERWVSDPRKIIEAVCDK